MGGEVAMAEHLLPCPFCEGPPCPIVQHMRYWKGVAPLWDDYGAEGMDVSAMVFCHDCGAEGPRHEATIFDRDDYFRAEAEAVKLWQQRDKRGRPCYDAGEPEGLNLYPRPDTPTPDPRA
jgi:hypothetical protein